MKLSPLVGVEGELGVSELQAQIMDTCWHPTRVVNGVAVRTLSACLILGGGPVTAVRLTAIDHVMDLILAAI